LVLGLLETLTVSEKGLAITIIMGYLKGDWEKG